ncbi:hypothetical protein [Flavobacterium okayamense]|uniref:Uncharacterized protein n=1 Tax=Flavobacterium okayamense TaxID=2830782 RepID=A0ABM7S500_9FLAO|nr:hypothetical protein [Flavobacterium okayamense]BCY27856.1 hypothetical protein KK2020170_07240 [Flavobacterium okayamense]
MKLTSEQINKIDIILEKLGLDFLDFKLEIKDHIACQVEEEMELNQSDFNEALLLVLKQWEQKLVLSESVFISNKRTFPKIVINQLFKRFLIYNIALVVSFLFGILTFNNFLKDFENELFTKSFRWIFIFCFFIFSALKFKIYQGKFKTSYSYMFNQNFWLLTIYFVFVFLWNSSFMNFISFSLLIAVSPFLIYSFYKHQHFINKYQLV